MRYEPLGVDTRRRLASQHRVALRPPAAKLLGGGNPEGSALVGFSHGVVGQKVTGQEDEHERGGQDCETQLERLAHLASLAYP